jgi:O-Antigen ligase
MRPVLMVASFAMDMAQPAAARALLAASGVLLGGALFFGGGSGDDSVVWLGAGMVLVLSVAFGAGLLGAVELPRTGRPEQWLLASAGGFVAWAGLSVLWSVAPDRSWDAFNKGLVLLGFLLLGLLAAGGPAACRFAAGLLAALIGAVLVWSLLGKAVPALQPDGGRIARLRDPVGYWNGLALVADFALPLGLWLGSRAGVARSVRAAGALLVYAATLVVLLAASRTGLFAAAGAVALWLVVADRRVEGALAGLAGAVPALALAGWAFSRPALVDDGQAHADRVRDGAVFGALALVGAAFVTLLVVWGLRRGLHRRREVGRALAVGAAGAAAVALVALVVAVGNPVAWAADQFSENGATTNAPSRLLQASSNNRWRWWNEAWDVWRADPLVGSGAGSFEVARKRYRSDALPVSQPHSVPLQGLSDGGIVGLALFVAAVAAGVAVAVAALRRLGGEERAAATALAVLPAAWLLHGLADYDLDFLATTAPPLFALGVLGSAGRAWHVVRRPAWVVAVVAVALAVIASLAAPPLADRGVAASTRALERRDFGRAVDLAQRARSLDPFALEPIRALAFARELQGDRAGALAAYRDGVDAQPDNPRSWELLGRYEFSLGDLCSAYRDLNEAYTRDPNGSQWSRGSELDRARDYVNAGRCG